MKKIYALLFLAILGFASCEKDSSDAYSYNSSSTIYSSENSIRFKELLLVLKPYVMVDGEKKYVVTETIYNVKLSVNGKAWGSFDSYNVNTSLYVNSSQGDYLVSDTAVRYAVIAPFQSIKDTLTTAGEYAQLLNNIFVLEPGFYFCKVDSFEVTDLSGVTRKFETSVLQAVEIKENSRSAFLGEFEVLID